MTDCKFTHNETVNLYQRTTERNTHSFDTLLTKTANKHLATNLIFTVFGRC